jgi:hypothetical protein
MERVHRCVHLLHKERVDAGGSSERMLVSCLQRYTFNGVFDLTKRNVPINCATERKGHSLWGCVN